MLKTIAFALALAVPAAAQDVPADAAPAKKAGRRKVEAAEARVGKPPRRSRKGKELSEKGKPAKAPASPEPPKPEPAKPEPPPPPPSEYMIVPSAHVDFFT